MKEITIEIAAQPYTVKALSIKGSRAWRAQLGEKFDGVIVALQGLSVTDVTQMGSVGDLLASFKTTLITSIDEVLNLVCAYAPAIEADRARVEEEGTDDEAVEAFTKILGLAFPLGNILKALNGR